MAKLTIMIPIYNEGKYILETLQSVQNQTYKDFICIISDNNSTDDTSMICEEFIKNDNRFIYFRQKENIGAIKNMEFIIKRIDTQYTMLFSGHDILEKEFVSKTLEIIENNSNVSLVFSKAIGINEDSKLIDNQFVQKTYSFSGNALSRYIRSVRELDNCSIVQGIFKSEVLNGYKFAGNSTGVDHVFLSYLLWHGELHTIDEILYKRRFFKKRDSTSEERITGPNNQITLNYYNMCEAYLENFNSLYSGPDAFRNYLNNKILDILTSRFGMGSLYNSNYKG